MMIFKKQPPPMNIADAYFIISQMTLREHCSPADKQLKAKNLVRNWVK